MERGQGRMDSMTDAELAVLSQRGNLEAFNELARRWHQGLYWFVRRMLSNDEDARDACQDALLKAYQNIGRLRDPSKFKAWLHHIALNLCRDRYRSAHSRVERACDTGPAAERALDQTSDARPTPDSFAETSDLAEILSRSLDRLSLEQRTAIVLREYQGFSTQEIAQITGVPTATVRTRIFYGLKTLRRILPELGVTPADLGGGGSRS